MTNEHWILAVCWLLYCFLHSLLASAVVKEKVMKQTQLKPELYRIIYILFAFAGLVSIIIYAISLQQLEVFSVSMAFRISGYVIGFSGLLIMVVCIYKYFRTLSGLGSLLDNQGGTLMISGIHRFVRHPLYLGTFMAIWGAWLLFPLLSLLISNVIITVYTVIGIRFEEKKLVDEFGEAYREYSRTVPKLFPRIRSKRPA